MVWYLTAFVSKDEFGERYALLDQGGRIHYLDANELEERKAAGLVVKYDPFPHGGNYLV